MSRIHDAVVVGSGFGASMAAYELVHGGLDVVMVERGDWVPRGPESWAPEGSVDLTAFYERDDPYRVRRGGNGPTVGAYRCVGGPSVFFGGVTIRFREADFAVAPEIVGDSGAAWPLRYDDLEPYYTRAERILEVAGESGADPTEPPRSAPFPRRLNELSETSQRIGAAATALGLAPFRLPLAISYEASSGRRACVACTTCDTFACAIGAKNDLATQVLPDLLARGLDLRVRTVATRILAEAGRVRGVECVDAATGRREELRAETVFLSAGALASPHLLLASGLERENPAGGLVGRHLMRHCNAIVFGVFPRQPNPRRQFHKQLAVHDLYFGHESVREPPGKLGSIQQLQTPPIGLVKHELPRLLAPFAGPVVEHLTGLLVMAEDQPRLDNRVDVDWSQRDAFGLPQLTIDHRYTRRDLRARDALVGQAKRILRRAGAPLSYVHRIKTFSHAVGTVRFGEDPASSVLDPWCGFRGVENLYVVDASFMPTSAGLNPSLTISANALRVGAAVATGVRA